MLLDRRKVKFWQKIVFGLMAFLMAAFLIVGYSGVLQGCDFGGTQTSAQEELNKEVAQARTATTTNPKDAAAWIKLGEAYMSRSSIQTPSSAAYTSDLTQAAAAYTKANKVLEGQKGVKRERLAALNQLATIYGLQGDAAAVQRVYGDITTLTPKDPEAFLNLGTAARSAGDVDTALLAFNRFLELDPTSPYAKDVKDTIASLAPAAATPSPSPTN